MSLSEEEVQAPLSPPVGRKPRRWVWAGLVGVATVGAFAAVAFSGAQPKRSSVHRFANAVRAFSIRALQDKPDFVSSASFTFNEVDAEVPSKTGLKVVLQQSEEEYEGSAAVMKVIFHAKEGKGKDLAEQIKKVQDAFCKEQAVEYGEDAETNCAGMLSIAQVEEADEAAITLVLPEDEEVEGKMEETMKGELPKFEFELFFGNTIKDMFDGIDTLRLPLLFNGVHASMDVAIPSALAKEISEEGEEQDEAPGCPKKMIGIFFSGLARQNVKYEVLYKSEADLGSKWDSLPTSSELWSQLIALTQHLPRTVRDALQGLDEVADGLKSVSLSNLPEKLEVSAAFTNFKVSEVIKAMLEAPPPQAWYMH